MDWTIIIVTALVYYIGYIVGYFVGKSKKIEKKEN